VCQHRHASDNDETLLLFAENCGDISQITACCKIVKVLRVCSDGRTMSGELTEEERRDAARIAARRQREADRVQRFLHDPFNRQTGQDREALEQQIREKKERDQLQKNQELEELEQQRRVAAAVEALEQERLEEERRKKAMMQASWAQAAQLKKEQREREARREKVATERSSFKFAGEDPFRGERKRMQAIQMQRWCDQQTTLKQIQREKEAQKDAKYLQSLAAQEQLRQQIAAEKEAERKRVQDEVRAANLHAAQLRREQTSRERKRALQGAGARVATEDFLNARGNEFKGLTPQQKRAIQEENARLAEEAALRKRRERDEAEQYGQQLRAQATYAERCKLEDEEEQKRQRAQHLAFLQQQTYERELQEKSRNRHKGPDIDTQSGFFDGFGRSSR